MGERSCPIRPYPAELEGEFVLRDGTRVHVRPIRPEDVDLEKRFVEQLSEQSRFQRFLYHLTELPPGMLARFTQPDYDRELALVALHDGQFIGVARYAPNSARPDDPSSAEFALVVADHWQRRGLGRALLEKLKEQARKAGYRALYGTILDSNYGMQELTRKLGFVQDSREGPSITVVGAL